jgi:DNA-binding NtrC family response regulator
MSINFKVEPIKTLLIEDNPGDIEIITALLSEFEDSRLDAVNTLKKGLDFLKYNDYNSILLDLNLPDSTGVNTLLKVLIAFPEHPVVVLTGHEEAELGILSVQCGAQDFLNKNNLTGELIMHAINYAIERNKLVRRLKQSMREIERLRGLLPICMSCKKIRDDNGYWAQVDQYLMERSSVKFTHSICPDCQQDYVRHAIEIINDKAACK